VISNIKQVSGDSEQVSGVRW